MTLTEGMQEIRDEYQDHENDGIAFAKGDLGTDPPQFKIYRITDVFVKSDDVLLQFDPAPTEEGGSIHMTVRELLDRLIAFQPE